MMLEPEAIMMLEPEAIMMLEPEAIMIDLSNHDDGPGAGAKAAPGRTVSSACGSLVP